MLPYASANNPLHWRERAEESRAMANCLTDKMARETLLRVADAYDEMAKRAEHHALWKRSVSEKA